jgi:hypothetical protein
MDDKHAEELLARLQEITKELRGIKACMQKILATQEIIARYTKSPVYREAPDRPSQHPLLRQE